MSKLLNNTMVFVLEFLLCCLLNLLPESICFQQTILETIESGEPREAFMVVSSIGNLTKAKKTQPAQDHKASTDSAKWQLE